uniref:Uncharacterized protein n=1 Tax=Aegilops tauschii TaxID=37682 RepID=M8BA30_AEGTA
MLMLAQGFFQERAKNEDKNKMKGKPFTFQLCYKELEMRRSGRIRKLLKYLGGRS